MEIYEKLMMVQQKLKCSKSQYNSFGKYHYRSCEDILEGLKPCLKEVKAAVTVEDEVVEIGGRIYVRAMAVFHDAESDKLISNTAYAREGDTQSGMSPAQITGATSSYARKYALNGLFMIDDTKDSDTDENKIESDAKKKKTEPKAEVDKQLIDEKKVAALSNRCTADGVSPVTIMDKCHVKDLSQLTEKQFSWILANWSKEFVNGK